MGELKPCPYAECNGCGASGPDSGTEAEAVAAWNRREDGWEPLTCCRCGQEVSGVRVPKGNPNMEACPRCHYEVTLENHNDRCEDGWVSCEERLPETWGPGFSKNVLVFVDYRPNGGWRIELAHRDLNALDDDGNGWTRGHRNCSLRWEPVTHWRPLPDPPEPDDA